jgi:hypothetical protein
MAAHTKEIVELFCDACTWLHETWQTRRFLFDDNPDLANLKQPHYAHFFYRFHVILGQYCTLQLAKLHDPRVQSGRKNLSIDYMIDEGDWDAATLQTLRSLRDKLSPFADIVKIARNKVIAHNDLESYLNQPVLGSFDPGMDDEYFRHLKEFASLVRQRTVGDMFMYDDLVRNDIDFFMTCFNRGMVSGRH